MKQSPLLSHTGLWGRLIILVGIMAIALLITILPFQLLFYFIRHSTEVPGADELRILQFIQTFSLFIVPAYIMARMISKNPWQYMGVTQAPKLRSALLVILSIFVMMPFMEQIILWNEAISFPPALAPIENWMRESEQMAQKTMETILSVHSVGGWLINLFLVGVMAAVSEELFFRGLLQNMFLDKWHKKLLAVVISAFIFSAIHFQFYGFVPRFLLGAYFGLLFVWSGNLWLPVLAHFVNNATALVQFYIEKKETLPDGLYDSASPTGYTIATISLILFIGIVIAIKKSGT